MPRVLFLCTGNTCRSPLAEVFARQLDFPNGMVFDSAGLQVMGKLPASAGSLRVAREWELNLEKHRSKPVSLDLLEETLWVIGMTRSHAAIFRSRYGGYYQGKIGVLGAPGTDLAAMVSSPDCEEVDDPYRDNDEVYNAAGEQIRRLVGHWAEEFSSAR